MAKLKVFGTRDTVAGVNIDRKQLRIIMAATSIASFAEALRFTVGYSKKYTSITANVEEVEIAMHDPGVPYYYHPTFGWRPCPDRRDTLPEHYETTSNPTPTVVADAPDSMFMETLIEKMARTAYIHNPQWVQEEPDSGRFLEFDDLEKDVQARLCHIQFKVVEGLKKEGYRIVSEEPPETLLASMAIRDDHGLGMPGYYDQPIFLKDGFGGFPPTHETRMERALTRMRQLYEEVVGSGFYSHQNADRYQAILNDTRKEEA